MRSSGVGLAAAACVLLIAACGDTPQPTTLDAGTLPAASTVFLPIEAPLPTIETTPPSEHASSTRRTVSERDFPRAIVDRIGRWETGTVWVERTDDSLCLGGPSLQTCPIDIDNGFTVLGTAGFVSLIGEPLPESQPLVFFTSADFEHFHVSSDGESLCDADPTRFAGLGSVLAFECEIPVTAEDRELTLTFTALNGELWDLKETFSQPATEALTLQGVTDGS